MDLYAYIWIAIFIVFYGVPFGVGLCVSSWRKAMLLSIASFAGLYASVWSALGPLFLPLAAQLVKRYELAGILALSFVAGAVQAALIATAGFVTRRLFAWALQQTTYTPSEGSR